MSRGMSNFTQSGITSAAFGTAGFFSAGVLHAGIPLTTGAIGTAAAASFGGGLLIYCPVVALRLVMHSSGLFNQQYRLLLAAIDLTATALAMPLGAYMLGLAIQPFLVAAAVACALYVAYGVIDAVVRYRATPGRNDNLVNAFSMNPYHCSYDEAEVFTPVGRYC